MIKYSIETVILNMKSEDVDKELTDMMSQSQNPLLEMKEECILPMMMEKDICQFM